MHPFSQKPWPIPQTSNKKFEKKIKNSQKKRLGRPYAGIDPRAVGNHWSPVGCGSTPT
jgi:hypothetical protein